MYCIITGTRNPSANIIAMLRNDIDILSTDVIIIHGGCRGVDSLADYFAHQRGIRTKIYKAEWDRYGRSAGPRRNRKMLKDHPNAEVWAYPGPDSIGTLNCIRTAKKLGHDVKVRREE
jgi:hypothetical protein